MATLADVIRKRRQSGEGVGSSLAGSLKEKLKEKFDPRRIFNQDGIMTALFPKLKAFKATGTRESGSSLNKKTVEMINTTTSISGNELTVIRKNTEITAKNSMVLPGLARDMNIMRQNISKLLKSFGVKPTNKADSFFKRSSEREKSYENQLAALESRKIVPTQVTKEGEEKDDKGGFLEKLLSFASTISGTIVSLVGGLFTTLRGSLVTLLKPITSVISAAFLAFTGILTTILSTILSTILRFFTFSGLTRLLTPIISRIPIVAAALVMLDALDKNKAAEQNRSQISSLKDKVLSGTSTEQDIEQLRVELDKTKGAGGLNYTEFAKTNVEMQKLTRPSLLLVKKTLEYLDSNDDVKKERGRNSLKKLGVSEKVLRTYYEKNKNAEEITPLNVVAEEVGEKQDLSVLFKKTESVKPTEEPGHVARGNVIKTDVVVEQPKEKSPVQGKIIDEQTQQNRQMMENQALSDEGNIVNSINQSTTTGTDSVHEGMADVVNRDIINYLNLRE